MQVRAMSSSSSSRRRGAMAVMMVFVAMLVMMMMMMPMSIRADDEAGGLSATDAAAVNTTTTTTTVLITAALTADAANVTTAVDSAATATATANVTTTTATTATADATVTTTATATTITATADATTTTATATATTVTADATTITTATSTATTADSTTPAFRILLIGKSFLSGAKPFLAVLFNHTTFPTPTIDYVSPSARSLGCDNLESGAKPNDDTNDATNPLACSMTTHSDQASIVALGEKLQLGAWTHVVLQDAPEHAMHSWYAEYSLPAVLQFVFRNARAGTKVLLVQAPLLPVIASFEGSKGAGEHGVTDLPAVVTYRNVFETIVEPYYKDALDNVPASNQVDATLVPFAAAIASPVLTNQTGVVLTEPDMQNSLDTLLTPPGNYLAACLLFTSITHYGVVNSPAPAVVVGGVGGQSQQRRRRVLLSTNRRFRLLAEESKDVDAPLDADLSRRTVLALQSASDASMQAYFTSLTPSVELQVASWHGEWYVPDAEPEGDNNSNEQEGEGEKEGEHEKEGKGEVQGDVTNSPLAGAPQKDKNGDGSTAESEGAPTPNDADANASFALLSFGNASSLFWAAIAVLTLAALWFMHSMYAKWRYERNQAWLRSRRGYDDSELESFNIRKDKTKLYDDGL